MLKKKKKGKIMRLRSLDVVFLIFLLVFVFRLFFVLQTPNFSDNDAYYNLRQIAYIADNGRHLSYDELSYGGREIFGIPIFSYIMSVFYALFGIYALKIIPAFFISMFVFAAYIIAKKFTEDNISANLAALCSVFIPLFIFKTLNNISSYSLIFLLSFFFIYAFYRIEERHYLILFILLSFLLPLMHPISFLLAISLIMYLILGYVENIEISGVKKEAVLFYIIVTFLFNFIIYKDAFTQIGLGVIWQNIPHIVLSEFFKDINILDLILNIGIVPLIAGIIGVYFSLRNRNKDVLVLIAICITSILLVTLKLLNFSIGLIFLGIALSVISAVAFEKFLKYIDLTKLSKYLKAIKVSMLLFIVLTLVVPSMLGTANVIDNTIKDEEIAPFLWMKENTALSATILTDLDEGNLATGIAERKSVFDTNFLLVKNVDSVVEEASSLFTLESEVKALELITKYDVDYIYLSEKTKKEYGIEMLKYGMDEKCFEKVFQNEYGEIIEIIC